MYATQMKIGDEIVYTMMTAFPLSGAGQVVQTPIGTFEILRFIKRYQRTGYFGYKEGEVTVKKTGAQAKF